MSYDSITSTTTTTNQPLGITLLFKVVPIFFGKEKLANKVNPKNNFPLYLIQYKKRFQSP